jgi:8-oxo-dGTP diphosphatase
MGQEDQGVSTSAGRYQAVPRTLCFITHGDDVLLLKGAPDKRLWANQYNGVGGHVERDEDVYAAALREICEETGWRASDLQGLQLRGLVNVNVGVILFVFTAQARQKQVGASAEGTLEWIPCHRLQDYPLVQDLPVLLSHILSSPDDASPFFAHYSYDENDQLVIRFNACHLPEAP